MAHAFVRGFRKAALLAILLPVAAIGGILGVALMFAIGGGIWM